MKLFTRFKKAPVTQKPREGYETWHMSERKSWGNHIEWVKVHERITGHLPIGLIGYPRLKEGDVVVCPMQSGKTGAWVVTEVKWMMDPKDMFFASVTGLGYVEDGVLDAKATSERA